MLTSDLVVGGAPRRAALAAVAVMCAVNFSSNLCVSLVGPFLPSVRRGAARGAHAPTASQMAPTPGALQSRVYPSGAVCA